MKDNIIEGRTFGEERALYALENALIKNCRFDGPEDGESALKEAGDIEAENCDFVLRYPLWHTKRLRLNECRMPETCRAGFWYGSDAVIENCFIHGIKFMRECSNAVLNNCDVDSAEFGWKCDGIFLKNCRLKSEYIFFDSRNLNLSDTEMHAKYSFQYVENMVIDNCDLNTKDAFWHSKNVTVRNSTVKGEYLAWYSEGLTLENCRIIGTQPLCYCKNLKLINCTMEGCDLAFEYSDVEATVKGRIDSVKNPKSGTIVADEVGSIIMEDAVMNCAGKVIQLNS